MSHITNLPLQTASGLPVELVTTKGRDPAYPLMGYVGDSRTLATWGVEGRASSGYDIDRLVNAPMAGTIYVVVWYDRRGTRAQQVFDTASAASDFHTVLNNGDLGYTGVTLIALPYIADVGQNDLAIDPHPEP